MEARAYYGSWRLPPSCGAALLGSEDYGSCVSLRRGRAAGCAASEHECSWWQECWRKLLVFLMNEPARLFHVLVGGVLLDATITIHDVTHTAPATAATAATRAAAATTTTPAARPPTSPSSIRG